jgi:hypothetical protein
MSGFDRQNGDKGNSPGTAVKSVGTCPAPLLLPLLEPRASGSAPALSSEARDCRTGCSGAQVVGGAGRALNVWPIDRLSKCEPADDEVVERDEAASSRSSTAVGGDPVGVGRERDAALASVDEALLSAAIDCWRWATRRGGGPSAVVLPSRSSIQRDPGGRPEMRGESSGSPSLRASERIRWAKIRLAGVGVDGVACIEEGLDASWPPIKGVKGFRDERVVSNRKLSYVGRARCKACLHA